MNFMSFMLILLMFLCILISVTFLTLMEQKVLSYIQIRKGPNKVGYMGLLQPFSDALKLFSKENTIPIFSNYLLYYFSPIFSLFLSLILWISFPFFFKSFSFSLSFLFMLSCLSLGVYTFMISGWSSNSNYALLGSLRAIAQTISYEVCMIFFFLLLIIYIMDFNLFNFIKSQKYYSFLIMNFVVGYVLLIIFFAETNRSPFDFAEGESELVSGFNVEYSSGGFILIFLTEYANILYLSMLFCLMLLCNLYLYMYMFLKIAFLSFMFIWVRGSFPRFRYDKLMYLTWKLFLFISLGYLLFLMFIKFFLSL